MAQWKILATTFASFTRPRIRQQFPATFTALNPDQTFFRSMSSIVTGQSGRDYAKKEVLRKSSRNPKLNIYRADFQGQSFVVKRVSDSFFRLSQEIKQEFPSSQRLRMHVDDNEKERVLVYEYYRHTFLALLKDHPDFPSVEIKKILRSTAEAVKELHSKNWIHIDIKPDNILVDWAHDEEGRPTVQKVALGDFDLALKLIDDQPLRSAHAVGNVMWRSPEGQSGKGVAKASDVFSLGLVCIYGLRGGDMIILDDDSIKALKESGVPAEQEIVIRHFMYFGPLPEGLLRHVDDPKWTTLFQAASEIAETEATEDPECRFERWPVDNAPDLTSKARDMITNMTRLDPARRASIEDVLTHSWW